MALSLADRRLKRFRNGIHFIPPTPRARPLPPPVRTPTTGELERRLRAPLGPEPRRPLPPVPPRVVTRTIRQIERAMRSPGPEPYRRTEPVRVTGTPTIQELERTRRAPRGPEPYRVRLARTF